MKKISLVTACKNRNECLKAVLPSWLSLKEVNEIIIVDWSSDTPLKDLKNIDQRIKVVRVENEKYYTPSQANNLGVQLSTSTNILRVDVDFFFNPYYNFFETYKIDDTCFISGANDGESTKDRENNPFYKYLFGLLYITKENFLKVNGYNENIGYYYSHEDTDIFKRLTLLGLKEIKLKNAYDVIHIPHSDEKRIENFQGNLNVIAEDCSIVETHVNKNLNLFKLPIEPYVDSNIKWNIKRIDSQYFEAIKILNDKLKNLPQVNCISLEESWERREVLVRQFKKYNIDHIHFLLSKKFTESDDIVEGKYAYTLNNGTAGCCISHLKNIKSWLENTQEDYGFFCEDDLSLKTVPYWKKNWQEFIHTLPNDWDIVQLLTIRDGDISLEIRERLWNDWSATAYILKRDYAKKIVNTFIKDNKFILELPTPNTAIQPLIENLLFSTGKAYTIPLFIENIDFNSTFVNTDSDIDATTLHKKNHIKAAKDVLLMWKNGKNSLYDYATDTDNPESNFKMGEYYFNLGHTAPALSFFLRCAERAEDKLLAYEALIFGYLCYKEQKIRDETAKSLIMHAVCLQPKRPEAYWLISCFYEQKEYWMDSYYHAEKGLENIDKDLEPLKFYKDYPGKIGLLFQKAISGYWWGKNEECKNILLDLYNNYELNEVYRQSVLNNLDRIGVEL